MSSGFILGGAPLKLTKPLIEPAVVGSTDIVAGLEAVEDASEAGWDLLQPASILNEKVISAVLKKILVPFGRQILALSV
jgi:hypothetical protein